MSKWEILLENEEVKDKLQIWLTDDSSLAFEISNQTLKTLGLTPREMIPQYSQERLPKALKKLHVEILRTGSGKCVLTKTGERRNLSSLFPRLPLQESIDSYQGRPFQPVLSDSLLFKSELFHEETGVFLAVRAGILTSFLIENFGTDSVFSHCGRLNSNVEGTVYIGPEKVHIDSTQMECDAVFESNSHLIAIEAKYGFQSSFSIHQLIFPMILLQKTHPTKECRGIYFQYEIQDSVWIFQFHLLNIPRTDECFKITDYDFKSSKQYQISFE